MYNERVQHRLLVSCIKEQVLKRTSIQVDDDHPQFPSGLLGHLLEGDSNRDWDNFTTLGDILTRLFMVIDMVGTTMLEQLSVFTRATNPLNPGWPTNPRSLAPLVLLLVPP